MAGSRRTAGKSRGVAASKSVPLPRTAGRSRKVPAPKSVHLPRFAKGQRPEFYEDPAIDQLFAIVTALTGELSVLSDRLDTVERLLAQGGALTAQAIEDYVPDEAAAAQRAARRDELLRRVFEVLERYAARKAATAS